MTSTIHKLARYLTLTMLSLTLVCVLNKALAEAQITIDEYSRPPFYSAVSPEFPDGLHTRFLKYFAEKLDIELSIGAMPFARRVKELNKGSIDMMVGVSDVRTLPEHCFLLYPAYESMTTSLFTTKGNPKRLKSLNSMAGITVAITRNGSIMEMYDSFAHAQVIEVESLRQKIELVPGSDTKGFHMHLAVNMQSPIWSRKQELKKIIAQGIKNGDFAAIRARHYNKLWGGL